MENTEVMESIKYPDYEIYESKKKIGTCMVMLDATIWDWETSFWNGEDEKCFHRAIIDSVTQIGNTFTSTCYKCGGEFTIKKLSNDGTNG